MGLKNKINEIRQKPYRERVKLLWTMVSAALVIIVILWVITLRFRGSNPDSTLGEKFQTIFDDVKSLDSLSK